MKSTGLFNKEIDYCLKGKSGLKTLVKSLILRYIVILLPLLMLFNNNVNAQLVGSPGSSQSAVQYCAPTAQYVVRYQFEVSFGVVPNGWFRMLFRLENQAGAVIASKNYFNNALLNEITIAQDINPPFNWILTRAHTFNLPPNDDCEYIARIWLYEDPERDGTYSVVDLTQRQVLANWHTDDEGDGMIDITPPINQVCEGVELINFQFRDASRFACTSATLPVLSKPNFYERYVQFVYNTSAIAAQGIPNATISVYGTPVQLTDAAGAPMPNLWNVNPLDGSIIAPYSTASGYFEGPVISTGLNATVGTQQTFPISYPAGGTVVNDYFEVTLRNWNFCNKWNGSQTNPNAVDARTDAARIVIVDAPPAPTVPDVNICEGGNRTLTVTSAPAVGQYHWYSDAALTNQVAVGVSTYLPPETTVGSYDYYVNDQSLTGLLCVGPATRVDLNIYPVISNNSITADQTICFNTPAAVLNGTPPAGGDGNYLYLWQQSTVAAGGPWSNATGTNNGQNYDPGSLIATTWYRRLVTSLTTCTSTSNVVRVQVTPNNTITLTSAASTTNQTVCINTPITQIRYTTTGATGATFSGLPTGVTGTWAANVITINGSPSTTVGSPFSYTITLTGGCGIVTATGTIGVNPDNTITMTSAVGTDNQTVCINTPITNITYTTTGATGATVTGLPAGVTGNWAGNVVTISGTPSVTAGSPYNYTITLTGGCGNITATGTIRVNPLPVPTLAGPASVCLNSSGNVYTTEAGMTAYTWTVSAGGAITLGGGATDNTVTVTWNTNGAQTVSVRYTNANSCLAASPTVYNVQVGDPPTGATITGTDVCIGQPSLIRVAIVSGAPNYTLTIPEYAGSPVLNYVSGTDINVGILTAGPHIYTLSSAQDACGNAVPGLPKTVTVTVNANNTVNAASSTPTLCISTPLTAITHTTTGATGIGAAVGLPAGVTAAWAANTITISGTPTASGVFNYSIPLTGGCGAVNATGTITVTANKTVSAASSTPTLCINTPLTAITHTTIGATGIGAAVGLPAGVTAAWAGNTITISGTPTASGVFNYSIPLTGGCGAVNATGTITVITVNTVSAASSTPTLCISTPLTAITHTTTGATGIGAAVGLPAGVTAAWAANTITISGTPTASGVFNYSIPLTGGCGAANATGTITVTVNNTVSAASSTPSLCISTPLTAITHTTTGATGIGAAVGLPAGVTAAWAANTITISGTPTASGVFNYSIPLTGGCGAANATGTITVITNNTVSAASSTPTLCISTPLTAITHTTTGATGIGAAVGLPAGVTAAWAANTITISGTPTASGVFNYSIPLTGGCGTVNATGTITVTANKTVSAASSTPTLCISTPLTAITHTTTGATGIGAAVGLPAGVTAAWAANTITISGTPTASGVFNYSIPLTGGCGTANATGTITVITNNTVSAASSTPTLCISTPLTAITHTTTGATGIGAAVGLPAGVTAAWAANTITISGTPTASGVFNYSIPLTGGCGAVNATGTITVTANNTVSAASSTPTLCISTPLTAITHTTTGATGIGAAVGLPAGVTAAWAGNTITISGTPTATGVFNYSIPLTGGCGAANATGTITVINNNTVSAASSTPTLCISTPLTAITHTTTGATGIGAAVGLPAGITASWLANTITISGTPTASGVFNYSIPLTGGCGTANATGTITVITNNTVSVASSTPTLCISTPLTAITHTTTGATGIGAAVGLPAGVTAAWAANTITISGTPTASGVFNYSIPLTGGCGTVNATGTITVTANNTVSVASSTPTLCISTPLTAITHTTTGATGIGAAVGLPAGVTASWAGNAITISGTPTASGVFNYSIPLTGGCGTVNAVGTITVITNNTVSAASSTPTLCISTPLTAITHTTTGATGIGAAVGLPAGVTAAWAANTITISGTPTASGVFNYTIPLTGGCGAANATGTITVITNNTVSAASSTPTLCISTPLTAITHTTTGATGIGAAVGLPAGVTAAWAANTITISGTPTASGVFNYSIPLTGGCGSASATGTITVTANKTVSAASSTPTLCVSTPLTAITHTTTGATGIGAAVGLPAGVTAAWAANTITISGTPTATGVYNYSIPLTGGCGAANATGTITVINNNTVSAASSTPTLCISTPLTAITHTTTGATGIGADVGLPAGVTAAWAANTITISGTPTVSGVFNYTIPLTGGCGAANATGTITVITNNTVSTASSTPALCISTPLTAITHTTTGATGIGAAVGLPAGVTAAWAANTITISGTPTASGVFNYSIPLTGGCGTTNATGTITVVSLPATPAITGQAVICGTGAATYLYQIGNGSYLIPGNAYVWTVPAGATRVAGGGLTDNFVLLSFSATGPYTVQVTENTTVPVACFGIPQSYTINVYTNPVPNAGTPETICQGNATILGGTPNGVGPSASGGTGSYTYSWLPAFGLNDLTVEHPSANPAVTMIYQLMVTDVNSGCISTAPSSVLVTVNPTPTVFITNPVAVCSPATVDLTAAAVTAGSTAGLIFTYWTDAAATLPYATPMTAGAGTYYIKGTTAAGCYDIKPVTVTFSLTPAVVITNPAAVCSPSTVDITAAAVTAGSTAGLTYTYWADLAATIPYFSPTIATAGTYYIKGTAAAGCYDIKPVTVTVNPTPVVVITNPAAVCSPTTVDITAAAVTAGSTAGLTYTYWTDAAATVPYATPMTATTGTYYIKGTTVLGCYDVKPVIVTVNPTPTVVITNPAAVCSPATVNLTAAGITTGSTAGLSYTYWTDAAATVSYVTPATAGAGTYYIKGTTVAGCYDIKPVTVTVNPTPAVVITNPAAVCSPSTVDITAAAVTAGSTAGLTYTYWTDVLATAPYATPSAATAGTYYIKGTTAAGCYDVKPVTVTVNPTPIVVINDPTAVCSVITVNLTAAAVTAGSTAGLAYTYWTDAAATLPYATPMTAGAGTYYIKGTTAAGCYDIKPVTVTFSLTPTVVITNPAAVCSPATVDITAAAVTAGSTAGLTYTYWADLAATIPYFSPTVATAGTYYIKGATVAGCYDIKPVTVTVNPTPVVVITNPAAVCSPAMVDLTAAAVTAGSTAGLTYTYWTDAAATVSYATPAIAGAGVYYIKGTTVLGCYDVKPVIVTVNPTPTVVITDPAGVCSPSTVNLMAVAVTAGSTAGLTFTYWTDVAATLPYATPMTASAGTYYIKGTTAAGCYDVKPVTVTVNPLPVASISGTTTICGGDPAVLTVTTTAGATPFTVVLSDGTTLSGYSSGDPITVYPTILTTYTIASITDNNGCVVTAPHANLTGSATITTKVVPEIALQPVNVTVCEDAVATFTTNAGLTTNPLYQWYVDTGSGMILMPGETAATLILTAASALDGNQYQVVISGDCPVPVTSSTVTLTVNEKPEIITQPASASLCAGEDAVFTANAGVTTNPVYQWYVNPGTGWTPAVGARYQGANTNTLTVVSVLEAMSGYQYRLRVSGSCTPYVESNDVTLTVTRQAEITQHPVSITVCETDLVTFTVNAGITTNPTYQWEMSTDGGGTWGPIGGANSATYTIASAATADNGHAFRAVVSSTCGTGVTSFPAYLTVNELPEITDQPDDVTICEYAIADFIVDAGVTTGATYRWQRSDDGGATWNNLTESATYFGVSTMNLKVNGTQRIMNGDQFHVIISGICTPPVTSNAVTLTVQTAPEILAQPVASSICENTNTSFSVTAQGTAITYQWFIDTGTGFNPVANGGVYAGALTNTLTLTNVPRTYDNYRYRVEVTGTCIPKAVSATVQLDVSIATIINIQPADSTICEFMTASFSAVADGANLTYQWQAFISGAWTDLTNTGLYIGVQTTMLMVFGPARTMDGTRYRVVIGSDCSADLISGEAVLTVYTAPELSDHPDEFRGCPGGNAPFSVVAAGDNLVYQWQVNTGAGFNNVTDNATYSGTSSPDLTINNLDLTMNGYLVRAVVSGTCLPPVTSSFAPLRVYMEPSIISEPADAEVCNEAGVIYYAQVFNTGAGETTVWQVNQGAGWSSLSDGALYQGTQTPQLVIMSADTTMTGWHYRLDITGPCGLYQTRDALLTVNAPPRAYIANVDTLLVCGGIPTQLHGNPAGGSLAYSGHRWFGDVGPLSAYSIENPVFNTSMPGYYRLIYQVTDSKGCVGLDTLIVQVEKPVAMFTVDAPSGCQPLTVNFTNGSIGYASVLWNFGDTTALSTDINPQHTYYNAGPALAYFTVELEVTSANGCVSKMSNGITVYPEILSDFTMNDDTICSGESITFSLLPGAFRYFWNFGDGQSENGANVINHVFMNNTIAPVTYDVILTTESFFGCQSADTMQVVVYPTPVPGFTAAPVSQTFPNATVTFTNSTNAGTWIWLWDFADGNSSAVGSPVHTYAAPGEYAVSLTASNAVCMETVTHNVSVLPTPPIASFDPIPSGCMPWNISINNTSQYATSYYWDFGDGYTSNALNPSYTYMQEGSYQVTLTVQGPGGSDTETQMVYVYQKPRAYFEVSPIKVYVNDEKARMFNLTEGADSFVWEFGDGDTSHLRDPYHKYTTEGIYDITLHAYSANGCYDTYILSPAVTVEPFGKLVFATVFRPNQDGPIEIDELPTSGDAIDQFFFPPIRETVLNYHMQVFNRWGMLIFETYDINKPWNGYYKGKLCAQGVYVWLVEGKYANGRPFKEAGDITLLH